MEALPRLFGGGEVLRRAKTLFQSVEARGPLAYLAQLYARLEALGLHDSIDIDLGLVHGQRYYTGLVFRGYIEGSGRTVLSGGRYDGLLAEFGRPAAAVGFGVALDSLAEALLETGALEASPGAQTLVFGAEGCEAQALQKACELRKTGGRVTYSVQESLEEALRFAKEHAIPRVIVVDGNGERVI
jgi:ATP phosphoribosyltransferase regulatory subunit